MTGSVNGSALASRPWAPLRAASIRACASASLSSAPTWTIQPVWVLLLAVDEAGAASCGGISEAIACCGADEAGGWLGGRLEAGSTPRMPLPVPWPGGCGGSSLRANSLAGSVVSALATTALEVSATSGRGAGIALVTGGAGWDGPAEASFIGPALT